MLVRGCELEIEYAAANTIYGFDMKFGEDIVDFGTLTTNERGCVKVDFEGSLKLGQVQLNKLLFDGKDVRDIH